MQMNKSIIGGNWCKSLKAQIKKSYAYFLTNCQKQNSFPIKHVFPSAEKNNSKSGYSILKNDFFTWPNSPRKRGLLNLSAPATIKNSGILLRFL